MSLHAGKSDEVSLRFHLHMSCLAQGAEACLCSTLVLPHLEADLAVPQLSLLVFVPLSLLFISHLGTKTWSCVLRVFLGDASEGVYAEDHLVDVASLEKICRLEDLLVRHAILLNGLLEPLNVLHEFEGAAGRLDLLDGVGLDLVDEVTEDDAIFKHVLEVAWRKLLP